VRWAIFAAVGPLLRVRRVVDLLALVAGCPSPPGPNLPHKPVEPEAAALEMNVRVPGDVFHTHAFTPWSSARVPVTGP